MPNVTVTVHSNVVREKRTGNNVVAYLPATGMADPAQKPWVAVGAHYDHLGHGESGNSLAGKATPARSITAPTTTHQARLPCSRWANSSRRSRARAT